MYIPYTPHSPNPKAVNQLSSKIKSVDPGSPGQLAGILPGDTLVSINGKHVVDVLDYKFYSYDPRLKVELADADGNRRTLHIRKAEGQDLGLEFETYLMDHAHRCANNCVFCFVDQMPKGLRDTLYFKDDDDRLSFLLGNYVTLTNLSPREIQRIIDLRISPINVSVHTTDPELRVELMGNRNAGKSIDIMRRLAEAGIHMNCQIVACPGLNDGPALARSMRDLTEMRNGVTSVAIVPVGLTKYRDGLYPLRSYTAAEAGAVIDQVEAWSEHRRTPHPGGRILRGLLPAGERRGHAAAAPGGVQGGADDHGRGDGADKALRHRHRHERRTAAHPAGAAGVGCLRGHRALRVPLAQRLFRA